MMQNYHCTDAMCGRTNEQVPRIYSNFFELPEEGEGLDLNLGLVTLLDGEDLLDDLALGVSLSRRANFYF